MNGQRPDARDFVVWCTDAIGNDYEIGRYNTRKEAETAMEQHIQRNNQPYPFRNYRIVDTNPGYKVVKR
ncbi:hypothetical protein I4U23_015654 [Adineta vaga]|nr:hypothetical protein I4U23_015654 [Adineta vaga]